MKWYVWAHSLCGAKKLWYDWNEMNMWMRNDMYEHTVCVVQKNCDMNGMKWICEYVWARSLCGARKLWYGWNEMNLWMIKDVWAHNLCGAKELWYEMNMWMQWYEWALNDYE